MKLNTGFTGDYVAAALARLVKLFGLDIVRLMRPIAGFIAYLVLPIPRIWIFRRKVVTHILFPLIDVSAQYLESVKIISTTHKILIFLMKTGAVLTNIDYLKEARARLLEGLLFGGPDQYRLPIRLCKALPGTAMLNDRGYAKFAVYFPHLNRMMSPAFVHGRAKFHAAEMEMDSYLKRYRYTSETVLSRAQNCRMLRGIINFQDFPIFQDALCWGYMIANLYKPLRLPGDWSTYLQKRGYSMVLSKRTDGSLKYTYKKV